MQPDLNQIDLVVRDFEVASREEVERIGITSPPDPARRRAPPNL
jgi:hypothetical protein